MVFLSQLKSLVKIFIQKRQTTRTAIAELFSKICNKNKISNKKFQHGEANTFLEKVTKSIDSQTNMKSSGNNGLTANFINIFQMNYPITLINNILSNNAYVYQSWENLGTIGVSFRTRVIFTIYKKG